MATGSSEGSVGVREGDILAGKYRIDKILGEGGMGVVVAAHHIHLDERVAIKFLLPAAMQNAEAVARFAREARAAVKIKSEHVARVTDVGTLETGAPYMIMEYLEGWDLSALVERTGQLPIDQAVEFILQACEAMADAHGIGIVHRDLKPANLFCIRQSDGMLSIKVLDFGISKMTGSGASGSDMGMTKTTAVLGSPLYMSPEQMQSARNVDARADIWAIGVILYELVTGRVPFDGESLPELCVTIMSKPPAPIASLRSDVPPGLEQVILKCLEKDRNNRYANVADLAVALGDFGPNRSRASVVKISRVIRNAGMATTGPSLFPSSHPPAPTPGVPTMASWGQTNRGSGGIAGRVWIVAGGAVAVLAIGAGGIMFARRGSAPASVGQATGLVTPMAPVAAAALAIEKQIAAPAIGADAAVVAPAPVVAENAAATTAPAAPAAPIATVAPPKAAPAKAGPAKAAAAKTVPAKTEAKAAPAPATPAAKPDSLGGRL
jgi:eukaryotic-like serine/threonine-protein kinase